MMNHLFKILYKTIYLVLLSTIFSQNISSQLISSGYDRPVLVRFFDDKMFVVEQSGKVYYEQNGQKKLFIDLSEHLELGPKPDERGLLGFAFDPEFNQNKYIYVSYIASGNNTKVVRYEVDKNTFLPILATEKILFYFNQPYNNHNGGHIEFNPFDKFLYIAFGDGGSAGDPLENGQDISTLFGSIVRVNPRDGDPFSIPEDNPFVDDPNARPEIWVYGLRNPWKFTFDSKNGDMIIADVGQNNWEEINLLSAGTSGKNFGWNTMEASSCYKNENCNKENLTLPIFQYPSDATYAFSLMGIQQKNVQGCSVTGGYVYRKKPTSKYYGKYLFSDFCTGKVWSLDMKTQQVDDISEILPSKKMMISSFAEDLNQNIYIVDFSGEVYKLILE
jgi:glucose/arabinose dehydrogenase